MPTKNKKEVKPASLCTSEELQEQKEELECAPSDFRNCDIAEDSEPQKPEMTNPKQKKPRSETWYLTKEVRKLNKTMERILRQLETANSLRIINSSSYTVPFENAAQDAIEKNGVYEKYLKENAQRIFEEKHKKGDEE